MRTRRIRRPDEAQVQLEPNPAEVEDLATEAQLVAAGLLEPIPAVAPPVEPKLLEPSNTQQSDKRLATQNSVTVSWGQETYVPVAYNSCHIGPFSITTYVEAGETLTEAMQRAHAQIEEFVSKIRSQKLKQFKDELIVQGLLRG